MLLLIILIVLSMGFLTYCMCAAAGREDERLDEYEAADRGEAKDALTFLCKHNYVKHYDQKREEYVMRCTKCNKVTDR